MNKMLNRMPGIALFTNISVFLLIGIMPCKLGAQETKVIRDLEQWTNIGITKKINKNWRISLDQEFRLNHNASEIDIYFADLGVDYKLNKHFRIGADYRFYQNKNNDGVFETKHRWSTDFKYRHNVNRFLFEYRLRFQNKDEDFYTSETGNNLYTLKNRFSVNYNIKDFKFDPFLDAELYRRIDNIHSTELNKLRWTIGIEHSLKEFGEIEIFYRLDHELNTTYPKNTNIIGLGYKFTF